MKAIPLTQGKYALVDDEDYEWLIKRKWHALRDANTFYAACSGKIYTNQMHRIILGLVKGDGKIVDHKDRDGLNNQRYNLRIVSPSLNSYNQKTSYDNKSGYRGVCWNIVNNKWTSRITVNKVVIFLGHYENLKDAVLAYNKAAVKYWGGNARLNIIGGKINENFACV